MRLKSFFTIILSIILLCAWAAPARAVRAYPYPITVTQPDGSTITIQLHGDEFLHWTTAGGQLVAKGSDGFYYYATFNADGTKTVSGRKVTGSFVTASASSSVMPPATAISAAKMRMRQRSSRAAGDDYFMSTGKKKFLVMLIEFSDLEFTVPSAHQAFYNLLNQPGYSENGGTGSAFDYYSENSHNIFEPEFEVVGPVKVSRSYSYYGGNSDPNEKADYLLTEACKLVDSEVDFSQYDIDGDGKIDNIFFFFAGHNEAEGASEDCIWPHQWDASYRYPTYVDGVLISSYACTSEYSGYSGRNMAGIGTFCHEFGHVVGLPDFYDTDYEANGYANALYYLSLMCSGSYNNDGKTPPYLNAIERNMLGWMDEPEEWVSSGEKTIEPIENNIAYMTPTSNPGEFYVYENRQANGWDAYIGNDCHGLIIYHVDKSDNYVGNGLTARMLWDQWEYYNSINAYGNHECFDLVEADPYFGYFDSGYLFFPGKSGNDEFTANSDPAAVGWDKKPTGYDITNIRENGQTVVLTLTMDDDGTRSVTGTVRTGSGDPVKDASVTLAEASSNASANGIRMLSVVEESESYSTTTGSNGRFTIDVTDAPFTEFSITVASPGYETYINTFTLESGGIDLDITLEEDAMTRGISLSKYGDYSGATIGYGKDSQGTIHAGIRFTADEIAEYEGYKLVSVSFLAQGNSATEAGVTVDFGKERPLDRKLETGEYGFGSITTVDISDANLTVRPGEDMYIGYYIGGSDTGYPIGVDDGPAVEGGMYIYTGGAWKDYSETFDANNIIGVVLSNPQGELYSLGINTIASPKTVYSASEEFALTLNPSLNPPDKVEWFMDGQPCSGGSVILTPGSHTVEARLTYADGYTETLTLEVRAE